LIKVSIVPSEYLYVTCCKLDEVKPGYDLEKSPLSNPKPNKDEDGFIVEFKVS
jgi:hypothetical protein